MYHRLYLWIRYDLVVSTNRQCGHHCFRYSGRFVRLLGLRSAASQVRVIPSWVNQEYLACHCRLGKPLCHTLAMAVLAGNRHNTKLLNSCSVVCSEYGVLMFHNPSMSWVTVGSLSLSLSLYIYIYIYIHIYIYNIYTYICT